MKNLKLILAVIFIVSLSIGVTGQTNPPDPPEHGETGDQQPGGNAPVGGGLFILLTAGLAYGGKKVHNLVKGLENKV